MWIVAWAAVAGAQTWTDEGIGVLAAAPGTITTNGVGSPSVVFDPETERYVMFFETRTGAATTDCAAGLWSIGVASSEDGLDWDVWPDAVVEPTPGTPWRCVAAHPTAVYDGGDWHLWFKAEQGANACATTTPAWGCNNYSGISHAELEIDLDDKTAEIAEVEAELADLESQAPPSDAFFDALAAYEADLYTDQAEFACADPAVPGICAPCTSLTLVAGDSANSAAHTQPLCQAFTFRIPGSVTSSSNAANHVVSLSFKTTAGVSVVCEYRKNNGVYRLDSNPANGNANITARCVTPTSLVAGSQVSVDPTTGITMSNSTGPADPSATVTVTNLASQTFSGDFLDAIDELQAAEGDLDEVLGLLPSFTSDLTALVAWFAPFTPTDAGKTQLETDGQALLDQANDLEADVAAWTAAIEALEDELAELLAYTPTVEVVSLLDQVGVQINRVFGFPAAMKAGSTWILMFQDYPNIWRATSADPDGPFVVDAAPVIQKGTVAWANTEVFEPNPLCAGSGPFPYEVYFGGRTVTGATFTRGGISDGVSVDTVTWLLNLATQQFGWTDPNEFRHFDVMRSSAGQHRMWYSERVGSLLQINVASTTAPWDDALSTQRVCP